MSLFLCLRVWWKNMVLKEDQLVTVHHFHIEAPALQVRGMLLERSVSTHFFLVVKPSTFSSLCLLRSLIYKCFLFKYAIIGQWDVFVVACMLGLPPDVWYVFGVGSFLTILSDMKAFVSPFYWSIFIFSSSSSYFYVYFMNRFLKGKRWLDAWVGIKEPLKMCGFTRLILLEIWCGWKARYVSLAHVCSALELLCIPSWNASTYIVETFPCLLWIGFDLWMSAVLLFGIIVW